MTPKKPGAKRGRPALPGGPGSLTTDWGGDLLARLRRLVPRGRSAWLRAVVARALDEAREGEGGGEWRTSS